MNTISIREHWKGMKKNWCFIFERENAKNKRYEWAGKISVMPFFMCGILYKKDMQLKNWAIWFIKWIFGREKQSEGCTDYVNTLLKKYLMNIWNVHFLVTGELLCGHGMEKLYIYCPKFQ